MHSNDKLVILVVEDNHADIVLLKHQIAKMEHVVAKVATTLQQAEELLRYDRYDYVFLDGNLDPATKGNPEPDTLGLLKKIAPYYGCRVFTTSNLVPYQEKMIEAGCSAFVGKNEIANFLLKKMEVRGLLAKTKDSYSLHQGSLLVVRLAKPEQDQESPFLAYIAEIKETNPVVLKVADGEQFSELKAHEYFILEPESRLIQSGKKCEQQLLAHYARHMLPIRSGLAQFGGTMCDILPAKELQEA